MKRIISYLIVAAILLSCLPLSASAFSVVSVSSISYSLAKECVFYEHTDGEWTKDSADEDYFFYHTNFHEGDVLTVNYSNGSQKVYTAVSYGEIIFVNNLDEEDVLLSWSDVSIFHNQQFEKWCPENTYTYFVEYNGLSAPVEARVTAHPLNSISYTPSEPLVFYFESDGHFDIDEEGIEYYNYHVHKMTVGDVLTVNYKDGRNIDYIANFDEETHEWNYVSEQGETIPAGEINMFDEQYRKPYTLGNDNYLYVEYMGLRCSVPVEIVPNPISSVEYIPVKDIVIYENSNGEWQTDWEGNPYFRYDTPNFKEGDILNITYSETGETATYTFINHEDPETHIFYNGFYDSSLVELPDRNELYTSYNDQWELGDGNFMYISYKGSISNYVRVNIIENPVKEIRYEPANAPVYYLGDTEYDMWDNTERYRNPQFEDGDRLIVVDNKDQEKIYTYYKTSMVFMSEDYDIIQHSEVDMFSEQNRTPWELGDNNEYYVEYFGKRFTLYASVIESPYKSLEYYPAKNEGIYYGTNCNVNYDEFGNEYFYYYYQDSFMGDKLILTDKEDNVTEYTLVEDPESYQWYYQSENGDKIGNFDVSFFDKQSVTPWQIGNTNERYVSYMGMKATINVTILENPVKDIRFEPVSKPYVVEGALCYFDEYLGYNIYEDPRFVSGDKLIVTYNDDREVTFTARYNEFNDIEFYAEGYDVIKWDEVEKYSEQWNTPWVKGEDNKYFIVYMGHEFPVYCDLIDNPVVSIDFTPKHPYSYYEGANMYHDDWMGIDLYEMPRINEGDTLKVTYSDSERGTVIYSARFNVMTDSIVFESEDGDIIDTNNNRWIIFEDSQHYSGEAWSVGGENFVFISYYGKQDMEYVTIKEMNIAAIKYTSIQTPVVFESYSHPETDENGVEYRAYALPDFQEGDILTLITNDSNEINYVLAFNAEDGELYFTNGEEMIHQYDLMRTDTQNRNHWTVGGKNTYLVELFDYAAEVCVELVETDTKSVELVKVNPIVLNEHEGGEWLRDDHGELYYEYRPAFIEVGDKIVITYLDNSVEEYTVKHDEVTNYYYAETETGKMLGENDLEVFDRQYDERWTVGSNNRFYIVYHGVEAQVPVTIIGEYIKGDLNNDDEVTDQDAVYLLFYTFFPDDYPIYQPADFNGDGTVDDQDAVYLLFYTFFPEDYPLH